MLAYVLTDHKDQALVELKTLFGIQTFYTDGWGAYARLLDQNQHVVGKQNTQKIERKKLALRT
jgi:insertion element IS1 protein InsB